MTTAGASLLPLTMDVVGCTLLCKPGMAPLAEWAMALLEADCATPSVCALAMEAGAYPPSVQMDLVRTVPREVGVAFADPTDATLGALLCAFVRVERVMQSAKLEMDFLRGVLLVDFAEVKAGSPLFLLSCALDYIASGAHPSPYVPEMTFRNWEDVARRHCAAWLHDVEPVIAPTRVQIAGRLPCLP